MSKFHLPVLADDVYYVGVRDPDRRLFDSLIPLPQGTTYNAYLIKGKEKTALIDTVSPRFENERARARTIHLRHPRHPQIRARMYPKALVLPDLGFALRVRVLDLRYEIVSGKWYYFIHN